MTKERLNRDQMIEELAKAYATSLVLFGVDISEKWATATQQAAALNQAYIRGRVDERAKIDKILEEKEGNR